MLNEFNRYFERANSNGDASTGATADWRTAVDFVEYADKFVIYADVPGVNPHCIEITLEGGLLTLSGSRERRVDQPGVESQRTERAAGRFYRRFTLPDTADSEATLAKGANGVLEVVILKRKSGQSHRITVKH